VHTFLFKYVPLERKVIFIKKLERDFYRRDTITVAKELLGKYLVHKVNGKEIISKIVETEAYLGPDDKAAHSYKNRRTNRTEIMYGDGGFLYVFSIYGMHYCANIVTESLGIPQAVLLRALEPIQGLDEMSYNRFNSKYDDLTTVLKKTLTNGPGKLCKAMYISKEHNGMDLCRDEIYIIDNESNDKFQIGSSPRINIDYAEEYKEFLWRFFIKENLYVSKK
jgi:DNA-3-methyladenine glycosylase